MVHIFHHQALLRVERQELLLGDVEERPVEIGGVLGQVMASLYVKLDNVQHFNSFITTGFRTHRASMFWIRVIECLGVESTLWNG